MQYLYSDFYHLGSTDAMCDGLNTELSNNQTVIRRPGNPLYCTVETDSAVNTFYSFHESTGAIYTMVDTQQYVDWMTPTSLTEIFKKSTGAGQSFFAGVNTTLYITDGVDAFKWTPGGNINPATGTPVWNIGGVAPTSAPTLSILDTGSAGTTWEPSVFYTSMGLFVDSNNNIEALISVNANPTLDPNTTQIGTAGSGSPAFSTVNGDTTVDGTVTWTSSGPVTLWSPSRSAPYLSVIYDPVTGGLFFQSHSSPAGWTGSGNAPRFNTGALGTSTDDTQSGTPGGYQAARWRYLGQANAQALWQPSTLYQAFPTSFPPISAQSFILSPVDPATSTAFDAMVVAGTPVLTVQFANSGGSSGTSTTYSGPAWPTSGPGTPTNDGQLQWMFIGSKNWAANTPVYAYAGLGSIFSAIVDTNGDYQVCIVSGTTGSPTHPTWATSFGSITTEYYGGPQWANCGSAAHTQTWISGMMWYLPSGGFYPPQQGQPWGGANVIGSGDVQFVENSGESQTPGPPSWTAPTVANPNPTTTDNTILWYNEGAFNPNGFTWTAGFGYVYSFEARLASNPVCTTAPPLAWVSINTAPTPLGPPTGSGDGTVTTASPAAQTASGPGGPAYIVVSGMGSTDPQFDTIIVFRSADGFGAAGPYLYLTELPMPPVVNGAAGTWHVYDNMPDLPTATLPGLNPLIEAPVDDANDTIPGAYGSTQFTPSAPGSTIPLAGTVLTGLVYHQGRMWGFLGNSVFASGGPDTNPGNGFTSWPPINEFPFDDPIVLLYPTSSALLVFTTNDIFLIGGGPAITDYYSQLLVPNVGILSPNAVTLVLGLPYVYTSDHEFITIDPSGGFTRIGHPVGNFLTKFDPSLVYVTSHTFGDEDHAVYVSNGVDTWYRCDPYPAPDSSVTGPVWSPPCVIASGFKALASTVVSAGQRRLLIGPDGPGYVLNRDSTFTTFADNGNPYESFYTMGCIVLAHPGQMALCAFLEMDFMKVGSQPTVSVLFDELSATNGAVFEEISNSFVSDPPKLYGPNAVPDTLWMNRYYFGQTTPENGGDQVPVPAWCKFMQIKVDYGDTDTVMNETLAFTIFGALYQEK
jgi:hypothetical protein